MVLLPCVYSVLAGRQKWIWPAGILQVSSFPWSLGNSSPAGAVKAYLNHFPATAGISRIPLVSGLSLWSRCHLVVVVCWTGQIVWAKWVLEVDLQAVGLGSLAFDLVRGYDQDSNNGAEQGGGGGSVPRRSHTRCDRWVPEAEELVDFYERSNPALTSDLLPTYRRQYWIAHTMSPPDVVQMSLINECKLYNAGGD